MRSQKHHFTFFMKTFLIVYVFFASLHVLVKSLLLSFVDYPRKVQFSRGLDVFGLLLRVGFGGWAAYLLAELPE